jgi:nicotinate-nucleotide adenylyltransferase
MVERLAELYVPNKKQMLRAAALLHDITKEYNTEIQIELCKKYGIELKDTDVYAPKTLHARTAAAMIPENYPEFNDAELIGCVRWHTTGRAGMSICEKLVYLADYIDMSRTFPDCVALREMFWGADPASMDADAREAHLRKVLLSSYDRTVLALLEEGALISHETMLARNELVEQLRHAEATH